LFDRPGLREKGGADRHQKQHCKWVRLAAQRHLDDLARSKRKDWPFYFDPWHGNDVCDFLEKLPHVEGNWDTPTILLEPAQIFELSTIFGWRRKDTDSAASLRSMKRLPGKTRSRPRRPACRSTAWLARMNRARRS
jgi:phage terminase large subunit-like protein